MSSERFIKFIPSEEAMFLVKNKPNAFVLLTIIAERARRENGNPDGLTIGQCHIGDWKNCGLTEREYRTAKSILVCRKHVKIVETCRTRKKSTTGTTTVGTLVELISSTVYDINVKVDNDRCDDRATTERRPSDDEQERKRKKKKEEEEQHICRKSVESPSFDGKLSDAIKPSPKPKATIKPSDVAISLTEFFYFSLHLHVSTIRSVPANAQKLNLEARQFDEILKTYSESEIKRSINYGHANAFWQSIITNPRKLREKIGTLLTQLTQKEIKHETTQRHPQPINSTHQPRFRPKFAVPFEGD
jgi:hypothetical protein